MSVRPLFLVTLALFGCSPASDAQTPNTAAAPANARAGDTAGPAAAPAATGAVTTGTSDGTWPFGPAPSDDEKKAMLDRLSKAKDGGPVKSNWQPPGRSERYGHAESLVGAPYEAVRAKIADYPHYKDLAGPKFKSVTMVAKDGNTTDLYFNLPIMKGLVTIWYVTRFAPPRPAPGGGETVEGTFVKGNVNGMHITFTTRPGPDANTTLMTCDLNLALSLPAPQGAVDEELRDACGDAVNALRRSLGAPSN